MGSRSIKMALCSSRRLDMRPLSRAVKKVSGIHVSVCLDVEKLQQEEIVECGDKKLEHWNSSSRLTFVDSRLFSFVLFLHASSKSELQF